MLFFPRIYRLVTSKFIASKLISFYKMHLLNDNQLFPVFSNDNRTNWLILSENKELISAAILYLNNFGNYKFNPGWIHHGFAFENNHIGNNFFVVDEIFLDNTDTKEYPSVVSIEQYKRTKIYSYSKKIIKNLFPYDYESYYFFKTASKIVNKELILISKIIINQNIDGRSSFLKNFKSVITSEKSLANNIKIENSSYIEITIYEEIIKKIYFSKSQKLTLLTLLRNWLNLYNNFDLIKISRFSNAKSLLYFLKKELAQYKLRW